MRRIVILLACMTFVMTLALAGCGQIREKESGKQTKYIWYLNEEGDGLVMSECGEEEETGLLDIFLERIWTVPEKTSLRPLLDEDVKILDHEVKDGVLTLNFSSAYRQMSSTREVLARAGIVRTFVQLDEITDIRFEIEGEEAVAPSGEPLGMMNAECFVEDAGKQINAIKHLAINLYYTGESGKTLKKEARSIYYSSSKPLEWAIVERVIAGPKVDGNYPTVPANTQIISVTSANGVCYVNLNQTFVTNALNIDERIPVWSIVNSLTDNCSEITQVQFSIEGESNLIFRQSMDLSHPFEADYTLTEAGQAAE